MNKRIKELMIESGAYDHYEINEGVNGDELPMVKFAELIVKECAGVAEITMPPNSHPNDVLMMKNAVLEHFGVEE